MRSRWLDIGQVLSFCVFMDRDEVNKGFLMWLLRKFCLRDTAGSPKRARWLYLARPGSQSQRTIWFSKIKLSVQNFQFNSIRIIALGPPGWFKPSERAFSILGHIIPHINVTCYVGRVFWQFNHHLSFERILNYFPFGLITKRHKEAKI